MGVVTHIVAAEEDEAEAVAMADSPTEEWTGLQARDIDSVKLATLHCLLSDDDFDEALYAYEPVIVLEDERVMLARIPDRIAAKLAELDEEALERIGEELAATEEFEMDGWPVEKAQALLMALADLARLAESQGQVIFVWMYALET